MFPSSLTRTRAARGARPISLASMRMRRHPLSLLVVALALAACSQSDAGAGAGDSGAVASAAAAGATPPADQGKADEEVRRADLQRIAGDSAAKVWLIVVSDFQCPYCKMWHDSTDAMVRRDYVQTGRIRMAFVNFPLGQHTNAPAAHETAMCAAAQGKFWEVHDRIFETQPQWSGLPNASSFFAGLVTKVPGVDARAVAACVASGKMRPMIRADYERGMSAGVQSTPSFILGQQVIAGAVPPAEMKKALDAALAAAK
jgi:protein-disulfide isomerase